MLSVSLYTFDWAVVTVEFLCLKQGLHLSVIFQLLSCSYSHNFILKLLKLPAKVPNQAKDAVSPSINTTDIFEHFC